MRFTEIDIFGVDRTVTSAYVTWQTPIGAWTDKHNRYATRHMVDFVGRKIGLLPTEPAPTGRTARIKRCAACPLRRTCRSAE